MSRIDPGAPVTALGLGLAGLAVGLVLAHQLLGPLDGGPRDQMFVGTAIEQPTLPLDWPTYLDAITEREPAEDDPNWDAELHGNGIVGPAWDCKTMGDRICQPVMVGPFAMPRS